MPNTSKTCFATSTDAADSTFHPIEILNLRLVPWPILAQAPLLVCAGHSYAAGFIPTLHAG